MDASLPEFLLLFVIGLLVLGPERMAQVAKKIGHFVGYARRMSRNFQVQLEDELEMKQIRDSLPKRVDLRKELGLDEIENDVRKIGEDIAKPKVGTAAGPAPVADNMASDTKGMTETPDSAPQTKALAKAPPAGAGAATNTNADALAAQTDGKNTGVADDATAAAQGDQPAGKSETPGKPTQEANSSS